MMNIKNRLNSFIIYVKLKFLHNKTNIIYKSLLENSYKY